MDKIGRNPRLFDRLKNITNGFDLDKKNFYLLYTILFFVMILLVYESYFFHGVSFVRNGDGWNQHYRALLYYAKWLRCAAKTLFAEHSLSFPTFSFSIGYGLDIITTLHYYVIGDPLYVFAAFVPAKYMAHFYSALVVLRLYLAGLSFASYCFYMNSKKGLEANEEKFDNSAVLAGTFIYVFCGFALYAGVRHPYFLNPMIYLPLILRGCEMIFDRKSPALFIGFVFIAAISNFYLLYMIAILTVLYVIWRIFSMRPMPDIKSIICTLLKFASYALLGCAMSAVVLLPVVLQFLNDTRSGLNHSLNLLYNFSYYAGSLDRFLSARRGAWWAFQGYGGVALIAVILLFSQKKHKAFKTAFAVLTLMLMFPAVGRAMNGFSYATNRWVFGYSFFVAYVVVLKWESLFRMTLKEKRALLVCFFIAFLYRFVRNEARKVDVLFQIGIGLLALTVILTADRRDSARLAKIALILCVLFGIAGNSEFLFSPRHRAYVNEFMPYKGLFERLNGSEANAVKRVDKGKGFFRYSGTVTCNDTLNSGLHNTQYYWSMSNGDVQTCLRELELPDAVLIQMIYGVDSRTILSALANVKYYVQDDGIPLPYGFDKTKKIESKDKQKTYNIRKNKFFLPFGYTYSHYIPRESYEKMTVLQKQEAFLQGCVISQSEAQGTAAQPVFTGRQIPYRLEAGRGADINGSSVRVKKRNAKIRLFFDGWGKSETYCRIAGLSYEGKPASVELHLTAHNSKGVSTAKSIVYNTPRHNFYGGLDDFLINMGYGKNARKSITVCFPKTGVYSFKSLEIWELPMKNYRARLSALAEDVMEDVNFHSNKAFATNKVTGRITLEKPKYLLLTVPYSKGWTAYVDGEKHKILKANTMYSALYLERGEHEIELVYRTPGMAIGWAVSLISAALFLALLALERKKQLH